MPLKSSTHYGYWIYYFRTEFEQNICSEFEDMAVLKKKTEILKLFTRFLVKLRNIEYFQTLLS